MKPKETDDREALRAILRTNVAFKRERAATSQMMEFGERLKRMADEVADTVRVEPTSWSVLLKRVNGGFEPVRCIDLDNLPEDLDPDDWDVVLPIPDPETMPEFDGW